MRLGRMLVVLQVALSIVLLFGMALFVRSLTALRDIDLGFDRDRLVVMQLDARRQGYSGARLSSLYRDIATRAAELPGLHGVALADVTPLSGNSTGASMEVEGYTRPPGDRSVTYIVRATPTYFDVMGQPIVRGARWAGQAIHQPRDVIVNEAFVARYRPYANIGRRIGFSGQAAATPTLTVIGVARNAPLRDVKEDIAPMVYFPLLPDTTVGDVSIVARAATSTEAVTTALRGMLRTVDPRIEVLKVTTMDAQIDGTIASERLTATIASFFGALALVLASIGLYGILSQNVAWRTNEIGVRIALGATRGEVVRRVVGEAALTVLLGVAIGFPISLVASRGMRGLLFGVAAWDPAALAFAVVSLLVVGLAAALGPAQRAAKIDPAIALRSE